MAVERLHNLDNGCDKGKSDEQQQEKMEDELDDKIIYQTYMSHMKIMSRMAWGSGGGGGGGGAGAGISSMTFSPVAMASYVGRLFRAYVLKPEILIFGVVIFVLFIYLHSVDVWSRNVLGKLQQTLGSQRTKEKRLNLFNSGDLDRASWEAKVGPVSAYAVQGRRAKMEDRFVINDDINGTGVALFAVFDGHGGDFAANYAKDKLIKNLTDKVVEIKKLIEGGTVVGEAQKCEDAATTKYGSAAQRRKSFKKTTTDECLGGATEITDVEILNKLESLRPITREAKPSKEPPQKEVPIKSYFDNAGTIDFGRLLTDQVLAADRLLVEAAKKTLDIAGTTALIAILEGSKLIVANVGDSRGVMCDGRGNAIPMSFDHKPQQMRERKRIREAGGFVTFNGVWRVAGILATSRALGDYPLKDKKLVIADPDILTFELKDHRPMFAILASDGLWDTFSNEEAVAFIKERLHEPDYGAKSITLQAYYRGSLDNITVVIINFKENAFSYQKIKPSNA